MSEHEGKGRVVANGADVAQMVGDAFELRHRAPQGVRACRNLATGRCLHRPREGQGIGDRAVSRNAAGDTASMLDRAARDETFNALVDVSETFLQANDRLAAGGEAEMAGLDDAGMHGADRDLVQIRPFDGEKGVARAARRCHRIAGQRMPDIPASVIEPRPGVGHILGDKPDEVLDRPFQANGRSVRTAYRGKSPFRAGQAQNGYSLGRLLEDGHVHDVWFRPQREQGPSSVREFVRRCLPQAGIDIQTRPRAWRSRDLTFSEHIVERRHHAFSSITRAIGPRSETRRRARQAERHPRPGQVQNEQTSARRRPLPAPDCLLACQRPIR